MWSCGPNLFELAEEPETDTQAARYLETGKPDKAIKILLDALGDEVKTEYESGKTGSELSAGLTLASNTVEKRAAYLSLLSAAVGQIYGFDVLGLVLKMGDSESDAGSSSTNETSNSSGGFAALYPVLPDATDDNIDGFAKALAILQAIPSNEMTSADVFKQGLLLTATLAMRTKKLDLNGDGKVSPEEAINLSIDDATTILESLADAAISIGSFASGEGENSAAQAVADKLSAFQDQINSEDGADDVEKLQNFIAAGNPQP